MSTPSQSIVLQNMTDKVVVVSGGNSGIGKATAMLLACQGAKVAILARRKEKLEQACKEIAAKAGADKVMAVACDISDEAQIKRMYDTVTAKWGNKVDLLVANAGMNGVWAPIEGMKVEEFARTQSINLVGTFSTIKHAVPLMKQFGGAIVVVSSENGTRNYSSPGACAYACSKAAQATLTKMLAVELAKYHIRINAVCPGWIDTPIREEQTEFRNLQGIIPKVEFPEEKTPLGREKATPEQVANLIGFLLSDTIAGHISGTEVWIDGAESLLRG